MGLRKGAFRAKSDSEGGECLEGVLGTLAEKLSESQPISDKSLEGKAMDFFLTVFLTGGQGFLLQMKGPPLGSLRSRGALTLFTSKCESISRGDKWGLRDSLLVNKAAG